jgi:transposase
VEAFAQELQDHMKATKNKTEYVKLRAMYLFKAEKKKGPEVAAMVGTKTENIYQWSYRYNRDGIKGLLSKPKGGRTWSYLTLEEEKALLAELADDAAKGIVVITKPIQKKAEEKLGHPVSADFAEDLLNRHGWRKIMPRTKHPKSSKSEQEEFKKKFLKSLRKQ